MVSLFFAAGRGVARKRIQLKLNWIEMDCNVIARGMQGKGAGKELDELGLLCLRLICIVCSELSSN